MTYFVDYDVFVCVYVHDGITGSTVFQKSISEKEVIKISHQASPAQTFFNISVALQYCTMFFSIKATFSTKIKFVQYM